MPDVRHCGSSTRLDIDDFLPVLNLAGETICGSSELLPLVEIGKLRAGLDLDEGWIWSRKKNILCHTNMLNGTFGNLLGF